MVLPGASHSSRMVSPYTMTQCIIVVVTIPSFLLLHLIQLLRQHNTSTKNASQSYALASYNQLRSLPADSNTTKNLFESNGLVTGTERAERFILWPMGIPSPGAMRQWGHHATAFAGRRYFDDPCLLDSYYDYSAKGMGATPGSMPTHSNTQCAEPGP